MTQSQYISTVSMQSLHQTAQFLRPASFVMAIDTILSNPSHFICSEPPFATASAASIFDSVKLQLHKNTPTKRAQHVLPRLPSCAIFRSVNSTPAFLTFSLHVVSRKLTSLSHFTCSVFALIESYECIDFFSLMSNFWAGHCLHRTEKHRRQSFH